MRIALLLLPFIAFSSCSRASWRPLAGQDLSQWENYLSYKHQPGYNGEAPRDEQGNLIPPVGFNQEGQDVFTIITENNQPVIRVSGEVYGCLFTKEAFENYHLRLKVKWGLLKWDPRKDKLKDSGILYHSIGEPGIDYWRSWMLSQEFQVMEGHMGDYWSIANSAIDIRAFIPESIMNPVADAGQPFLPLGAGEAAGGFCLRSANYESPKGEWTTLELICFGDKSIHIVNGHVVMVLRNSRYVQDGQSIPLTKGKIQLQSEAAEVFFKDIEIRAIKAIPGKYAAYFH